MAFLGDLIIRLKAESADFQGDLGKAALEADRAMRRIANAAETAQTALRALGVTATVGGLVVMVKKSIDAADEMGKLAQKVGMSTEALSALKYAGELSNVSMEALTTGLGKLSNTMLAAANGGRQQAAVLRSLGVDVESVRAGHLTLDQALAQIAKRVAGMQDGWQKTALLQAAMGKGAKDLIPLLNDNADGFRAVTEEARQYGIVISDELAAKAAEFKDNLTRIKAVISAVGLSAAADLLPVLNDIAKGFLSLQQNKSNTTGFFEAVGEVMRLTATAAGSLNLALMDMGDGLGALIAQTAAFVRMEQAVIAAIKGAKWTDSIFDVQKKMEEAGAEELRIIKSIGAERDAQYARNKKQFEDFQANMLKHSKIFGDGGAEPTPKRPKGSTPPEIIIDDGLLDKFIQQIERDTAKLNNAFDPIEQAVRDKWLKALQIIEEANLPLERSADKVAKYIDAYREALEAARDEARLFAEETQRAQERVADWQASKQVIDRFIDSTRDLQAQSAILRIAGMPGDRAQLLEMSRQDMDIQRQSMTLTGEARDNFIKAAKAQQLAWAAAYNENYQVSRSFAAGFKGTMGEIFEDATDTAAQVHDLFTNAFRGMEDALVAFVKTGKLDFRSLADSIITDLIRIQIQRSITAPLAGLLGGQAGTSLAGSALSAFFGSSGAATGAGAGSYGPTATNWVPQIELPKRAAGGPVIGGMPTIVGERGPELFMPDTSGSIVPNGKFGGDTYYVDMRGASLEAVQELKRFVQSMNASIEQRAVGAVASERQRGRAGLR